MLQVQVTPGWPRSLQVYEYLRTATRSDWAWEYLRRNSEYQAEARLHHRRGVVRQRLVTAPVPHPHARSSSPGGEVGPLLLSLTRN